MLSVKEAKVVEILKEDQNIQELLVLVEDKEQKAYNYLNMANKASVGNMVLINTTAVELSLGTGGYHFVISNLDNKLKEQSKDGHIMKLRYTPMQIKVKSVEEFDEYKNKIEKFKTLDDLPVVTGLLHSMLVPFACSYKYLNKNKKIVYIMTDEGALPAFLSNNIKVLKQKCIIDSVITCGNAFGGDYEAINYKTAVIFAKECLNADVIFISMGPGITGTGTKYGFSGVDQANIIDCINLFKGKAIMIPRVSFADKRNRHYGFSHHMLTILKDLTFTKAYIPVNIQDENKLDYVKRQIKENNLEDKHEFIYLKEDITKEALDYYQMKVRSMGRNYFDDEEFFKSCGGCAYYISR